MIADVWSVTCYNELRKDATEVERFNLLNPDKENKKSYLEECLLMKTGPYLASSDYMRLYSDQIRPYLEKSFYSWYRWIWKKDTRQNLRKFLRWIKNI